MPTYLLLPIDWRIVFKYLGTLLFPVGIALLVPLIFSTFLKEWLLLPSFAIPSVISFTSGWFFRRNIPEEEVKFRDGMTVAALSFPIASLIGAFPYWLGAGLPWLDGLFEAMSGFSTTGLTVVNPETLSAPVILWRSMTQWLGGIGFVILVLGFLLSPGSPMVRLFALESQKERLPMTIEQIATAILKVYLSLTALGILLLYIAGMSLFDSVCFAFSALSTGGFSPYQESAAYFPSKGVHLILMVLMAIGATPFPPYYRVFSPAQRLLEKAKTPIQSPQVFYLFILISIVFFSGMFLDLEGVSVFELLFTVIAAQTTTGFSLNVSLASTPSLAALLVPAMFIGGSVASTAGGIKLLRLLVVFKVLKRVILHPMLPREEVLPSVYWGEHLLEEDIKRILGLVVIHGTIVFLSALIFVGAGYEFLPALFDVTSAVSTVGLSVGVVDPLLAPHLKGLIILLMWMGRVETFPVIMLCYGILRRKGGR